MTVLFAVALMATPVTLDEVRAASLANAQAMRAELERVRVSEQVRLSRASILPHLVLQAGSSGGASGPQRRFSVIPDPTAESGFREEQIDIPPSTRSSFDLTLQVTQLLYDGGRWWNQIAQAGAQEEAAAGQLEEQRLASELEGVRRYYELLRAQRVREVLEATASRSELQLRRARALFEAGRAQKREEIDAEVNLGNDRISVIRQGRQIAAAQAELAVWIGRSGAEELLAAPPAQLEREPEPAPSLEQALKVARAKRPLLKSLERQRRAAELSVDVAKGGYAPRVSLFGSVSRQSPRADLFVNDPSRQNSYGGGVTLSWGIFEGLLTDAQVRQAEAQAKRALLDQEQGVRELEGEVRQALAVLESQLEVVKIAAANRALAQRGLKLAEDRFQAGSGTTLDVRDAQLKLTQAELQLLESRIDVEIAHAALYRALGGEAREEKAEAGGESRAIAGGEAR